MSGGSKGRVTPERKATVLGIALVAYAVLRSSPRRSEARQTPAYGPAPGESDRSVEPAPVRAASNDSLWVRVDRLQKRFGPIAFVVAVVKKYFEDGGPRLAATVAYYGFFSVFPALLLLVAVVGFVLDGNPGLQEDIIDSAVGQFPVIGNSVRDGTLQGSGLAVIFGLLGAVWGGLGAMIAAQHALNDIWDVPHYRRPDPLRSRVRGFLMMITIGLGLTTATVLTNIVRSLGLPGTADFGIALANVVIDVAVALLAFQILTQKQLTWSSLLPGAVLAGLAYYGLQNLGSFLVTRYVSRASDTYGTFALVIGLLGWFHLLSQATLIAAETNVVLSRRLHPRTVLGDAITAADRRAMQAHQASAVRREEFVRR